MDWRQRITVDRNFAPGAMSASAVPSRPSVSFVLAFALGGCAGSPHERAPIAENLPLLAAPPPSTARRSLSVCDAPWPTPTWTGGNGILEPEVIARAAAPLMAPLQARVCGCARRQGPAALPERARVAFASAPSSGEAAAWIDDPAGEAGALAACVGRVEATYAPFSLGTCTDPAGEGRIGGALVTVAFVVEDG